MLAKWRMWLAAGIASGLVVAVPAASRGQTAGRAGIEGVVTDSSGAILPGVTVRVRNLETGVARAVQTDSGGRYRARRCRRAVTRSRPP